MSAFPGALPVFTGFTSSHTLSQDQHASQHNLEQAEIVQVATKVGTGASTPTSGMVLRGNGVGTSAWGQAVLTTDVSGILPVANGGTGQNTLTGLPLVTPVITSGGSWSGSPVFSTPTIADFTNATHTHANNAQGGQLNGANAITDGTLSFAELAATIFSGQVQSYVNGGTAGGTFYYLNLGGIKWWWGTTNSLTGGTTYTINLPPSFFSSIQGGGVSDGNYGADFAVKAGYNTGQPTLTTANIVLSSPGGDSATAMCWLIGA